MTEPAAPASDVTTRPYTYVDSHGRPSVTITIDDAHDALLTTFGKATLSDRYLLPGESFQDMFARVACANSNEVVTGEDDGHAQRIYDAIARGWFMPATPVLSNSGTRRGLPISCFLNTVQDSMESIAETVNENIWLAARGGGIGTGWSPVRSIDEPVGLAGKTSGIVPFLHWMGAQTLAISQGSLRRGSAAAYLDIEHPESEEFIDIRDKKGDHHRRAPNLHHGVTVTDAFMAKVKAGEIAQLRSPKDGSVRKEVDARGLWRKTLIKRLEEGEPYILFIDRVNEQRPWTYKALDLKVQQSNLCVEIVETTGPDHLGNDRTAVCCLSSLNWGQMDEWLGNDLFLEDVMKFVDNVLTRFIGETDGVKGFERARYAAIRERSVGIGMMGFHSYLQKGGVPYESVQAQGINKRVWAWLHTTGAAINRGMAIERGECPDSADARQVPGYEDMKPIRLTHVFAVAPTASISIICHEESPCGEPYVANVYTQKTLSGSHKVVNKHLLALLARRYDEFHAITSDSIGNLLRDADILAGAYKMGKDEWIEAQVAKVLVDGGSVQALPFLTRMEKDCFKTAVEMDQRWLIQHAADRTPYVCQSQSVNLFIPATVHKADLEKLHLLAHEQGLKSLYYLRSTTVKRAQAVNHVAGELPAPRNDNGPLYQDDMECLACQ